MIRSYSSLLFWLSMTIVASLMLYHTCDRVNELDQQLHSLNAQIQSEQKSLHVLKAEWVYLANPARIALEAQHHLNLEATATQRIVTLQSLEDFLPLRDGSSPPQTTQLAETQTPSAITAPNKHLRIASSNGSHINDHMIMQHSALITTSNDRIGALINTLGLRP